MRGRNNNRKSQNPLTRVYESNGPDVKIRGTASHIAEKYVQLARDAQTSGDPVAAENYYQHAEHYFRLIAAAQEQFRQCQSAVLPARRDRRHCATTISTTATRRSRKAMRRRGEQSTYGTREPQPYLPRDAQPYPAARAATTAAAGAATAHPPHRRSNRSIAPHQPHQSHRPAVLRSRAATGPATRRCRPAAVLHHRRRGAAAAGEPAELAAERPRQSGRPLPAASAPAPPSRPAPDLPGGGPQAATTATIARGD